MQHTISGHHFVVALEELKLAKADLEVAGELRVRDLRIANSGRERAVDATLAAGVRHRDPLGRLAIRGGAAVAVVVEVEITRAGLLLA